MKETLGVRRLVAQPPELRRLGPFSLVRRLGTGGFAPVWLARESYGDTTLRQAAVKLFALPGDTPGQRNQGLRAIVAEASALCRVAHPNVVRFYALPIDEAMGVMGLAMEYVDGISLEQRLEGGGTLPLTDALAIGKAVAGALRAVHLAGLVHRDVKPANIVAAVEGYKLIDFGVAAADAGSSEGRAALDLTRTAVGIDASRLSAFDSVVLETPLQGRSTVALGLHCGTMGYIDPACLAKGSPATRASDLYALGATLFRCLVGRVPAALKKEDQVLSSTVLDGRARPPPVAQLLPSLSRPLAALIDDLLAPEPAARPESAQHVLERLDRIEWILRNTPQPSPPLRPSVGRALPSAAEPFQVVLHDGLGACAVDNLLIVVHKADSRLERVRWFCDRLDQLANELRRDVVCLLVELSSASQPDTQSRLEYARRFRRQRALRRLVTVAVGDEPFHQLVQSITYGMNQAHGQSGRFVAASSLGQGIAALFRDDPSRTGVEPARVEAAVEAVCRKLDVKLPR
jgi:serine/threonine protein kinase